MRKFECKCGSKEFKVNPAREMIQCWTCSIRYSWKETKWAEFRTSKIKQYRELVGESVKNSFEWITSKLKHPKKEKPSLPQAIYPGELLTLKKMQDINIEKRIRYRWQNEIDLLLNFGIIEFGKNEHKGKLRGKNIARVFYSDLKRIGIDTRLSFKGMKGIVKRP